MREIKFKAWDSHLEVMRKDIHLLDTLNEYLSRERHIIMQYTGLKDKNGVEIYEGDILEFSAFTPEVSRWKSVVKYNDGYFHAIGLREIQKRKVIVIGNIHENKELLTK